MPEPSDGEKHPEEASLGAEAETEFSGQAAVSSTEEQVLVPAAAAAVVDATSFLDGPRAASHILCAIKEGRDDLLTEGVFRSCPTDTVLTGISATHWDFGGHNFVGAKAAVGLGAMSALGTNAFVAAGAYIVAVNSASALKNAVLGGAHSAKQRVLSKDLDFQRACGIRREELRGSSVVPLAAGFWDLREGDTVLDFALKAKRGRLGLTPDYELTR